MKKLLGPFLVLVLLAITVLLTGYGLYAAITTLPAWVWAIPAAALFGGWVVDRLMFWGINHRQQKTPTELAQAFANAAAKAKAKVGEPPYIPRTGADFIPPKGGSGAPN